MDGHHGVIIPVLINLPKISVPSISNRRGESLAFEVEERLMRLQRLAGEERISKVQPLPGSALPRNLFGWSGIILPLLHIPPSFHSFIAPNRSCQLLGRF
jgi:hypothetical protein